MLRSFWKCLQRLGGRRDTAVVPVEISPRPTPDAPKSSCSSDDSSVKGNRRWLFNSGAKSSAPGPDEDTSVLTSYLRGDFNLLEACLRVLEAEFGLSLVTKELATGGKISCENWLQALSTVGINDWFVSHFKESNTAALTNPNPLPIPMPVVPTMTKRSTLRTSVSSVSSRRLSIKDTQEMKETKVILQRVFLLLCRLAGKHKHDDAGSNLGLQQEVRKSDFVRALEAVQRARASVDRVLHVSNTRCKKIDLLNSAKVVSLLAQHAACAMRSGFYEAAHEDVKALLNWCEIEPHSSVRSFIHSRPPAAQLLGFVIRCAAREMLLQDRDTLAVACPARFGTLEISLRLCIELTRHNKGLMRPPELPDAIPSRPNAALRHLTATFLRSVDDNDAGVVGVASSPAAAAERLLNILQYRTISLALAPVAFLQDTMAVVRLLQAAWRLLDESMVTDAGKIHEPLSRVACALGIQPTADFPSETSSGSPCPDPASGSQADVPPLATPSVNTTAQTVLELEAAIAKRLNLARCTALYGGAFIVDRAVNFIDYNRHRNLRNSASGRRHSIGSTRRVSAGSANSSVASTRSENSVRSVKRHSTSSGPSASVVSCTDVSEHLEVERRRSSRADTWAALAAAHRLCEVLRPHVSPIFFEGNRGRAIPDVSEKLRSTLDSQLQEEAADLQARGWFQPEDVWSDLQPTEAGDDKDNVSESNASSTVECT